MGLRRHGESRWSKRARRPSRAERDKQGHPYLHLRTEIDERGDSVVTLAGELDLDSGSWLVARSSRVTKATSKARSRKTVLDLAHVSFIDATGLRVLMSLMARLEAAGRRVALRSQSPAVVRLLDLLDMRDRFVVAADLSAQ